MGAEKINDMYSTIVNLKVNYGFGVITMCQCRLINYNKCNHSGEGC